MEYAETIEKISAIAGPFLKKLAPLKPYILNPLFIIPLCVICAVLVRAWGLKKTVLFSLVVGILAIVSVKIELIVGDMVAKTGERFDPFIIRTIAAVILCFILVYFILIKSER